MFHKSNRSSSQAQFQLYMQDDDKVPSHYCRPGPGDYNIDARMGKSSSISNYQNSPNYTIAKPRTITDGFMTIQNSTAQDAEIVANKTGRSRSPSSHSIGRISANDIGMHRFVDYALDIATKQKQLRMLHPSRGQTEKDSKAQSFGKEHRKNPFPVKQEHATRC